MHRVKGLEFDRVAVASMHSGLVPLRAALDSRGDDAGRAEAETEERALVHVAAARAKKELLVLGFGTPSPLLAAWILDSVTFSGQSVANAKTMPPPIPLP